MAGKVLDFFDIAQPDSLAVNIARMQYEWHMLRQNKVADWTEIRKYVYATDTTKTTNNRLPWKNTTTIPKLCQIRDNLFSNYWLASYPKPKWLRWEGDNKDANSVQKKNAITAYMSYAIAQPSFKEEMAKCLYDYIDYGNSFAMVEWQDNRVAIPDVKNQTTTKVGYVGPGLRRISPLDIVFNPIAPSFEETPKIVRTIVTLGEVKKLLNKMSSDDNRQAYEELFTYLKDLRSHVQGYGGELNVKDEYFNVDGFTSYQLYLKSNYCELLWFYGDIYDENNDIFLENQIIVVVDRHKIISKQVNPSVFGRAPIYHVGWRRRQDNLWAMGPLDNLVGMQYRIDHIENQKADCGDLINFPPLKIKGYVEDFEWGPMARIVTHEDSDVEMMAPPFQVMQQDGAVQYYSNTMEEMSGSPKEAMGFRTPGEKTKYEVQRLENAASRIFQNKTWQWEEFFEEPALNGMLEIARRRADTETLVRYFNDDNKMEVFLSLTPDDISGIGRIKPFAARHFAEQAEVVQNLNALSQSPIWQSIAPHFSTIKLAKFYEDIFDLTDYKLYMPYVALAEQADAQRIANAQAEQVLMEALTPSGLTPDDHSFGPPPPRPQAQIPTAVDAKGQPVGSPPPQVTQEIPSNGP